jgi:hypothetical protein
MFRFSRARSTCQRNEHKKTDSIATGTIWKTIPLIEKAPPERCSFTCALLSFAAASDAGSNLSVKNIRPIRRPPRRTHEADRASLWQLPLVHFEHPFYKTPLPSMTRPYRRSSPAAPIPILAAVYHDDFDGFDHGSCLPFLLTSRSAFLSGRLGSPKSASAKVVSMMWPC